MIYKKPDHLRDRALIFFGAEGETRPLRQLRHGASCVGSPPLADADIPVRSSDIKSAFAALRVSPFGLLCTKSPTTCVIGL